MSIPGSIAPGPRTPPAPGSEATRTCDLRPLAPAIGGRNPNGITIPTSSSGQHGLSEARGCRRGSWSRGSMGQQLASTAVRRCQGPHPRRLARRSPRSQTSRRSPGPRTPPAPGSEVPQASAVAPGSAAPNASAATPPSASAPARLNPRTLYSRGAHSQGRAEATPLYPLRQRYRPRSRP